ncbi:MAG: hypothetical protein LBL26_07685 [Peptococcaceae bacterium]|jgi:hypothetical protein|nr:hypothetical protein [Peptococcaceae bacterium]
MDESIRQKLKKLTHYYAIQANCYRNIEALALDHARALVAPKLDMGRIQALLEQRMDILDGMESLVKQTRAAQAALCTQIKSDILSIPRLERICGGEPEFVQFRNQAEIHKKLLEKMIRLDRANEQVMKERMDEMKAAGRDLKLRARARRVYRNMSNPNE